MAHTAADQLDSLVKGFLLNGAMLVIACCSVAFGAGKTPVLGNYPDTSVPLSTNTIVTPDAAPTNTTRMNVSTSTNFKGMLEGNPVTGVVRVTDANPAGTYTVTVKAFDSGGVSASKTFTLTVTTPATCIPVHFVPATNFGAHFSPRSVAVGDFNGDGKQDLALANLDSDDVSILLGDGAGHFGTATNFDANTRPTSVAVGDFNGDGKQDLAVTNISSATVSILLGDGAGHFNAPTSFGVGMNPESVVVGDFNGDGKQDLAVANQGSNNVSILLGDGAGHFSAPTNFAVGAGAVSIAVGDFNGDGNQDLAVANIGSNNVSILLGDGAGHFSTPADFIVGNSPISVAVGDFNGDGNQDLVVANQSSNNVSILLGNGAGGFGTATNFGAGNLLGSVAVGDFNGDGIQDLAVANHYPSPNVSILLGNGDGSFSAAINLSVDYDPASVSVGDFNGDGKQDLAVANPGFNSVSILLRNCAAPALTSAVSRKTHGGAGIFDISLPLTGSPGIECRNGGTTNDYTMVLTFLDNVTITGSPQAQVTVGMGCVGSAGACDANGTVTTNGSVVTIPITNVTNAQTINVTLYGVNDVGNNVIVRMRLLTGDVNGNGVVNGTDISLTRARTGQGVDSTNFRTDVNANGVINATDVSIVKSHVGTGLSIMTEKR
jgi:hypothetical protein